MPVYRAPAAPASAAPAARPPRDGGEAVLGRPHFARLTESPSAVTVTGPNGEPVASAPSGPWVRFTPTAEGVHVVSADGAPALVVRGVRSLSRLDALRLPTPRAVVRAAPTVLESSATVGTSIGAATNATRSYVLNSQKFRIPWSGTVVGAYVRFTTPANATGWRFAVLRRAGSAWTLVGRTATITDRPTVESFVPFPTPIEAAVGDYVALEVDGTSTPSSIIDRINWAGQAATHTLAYRDAALGPVGGAVDVASYSTLANVTLPVYPAMPAPVVAVAGHSIMAGHNASHTFFEDTATAFDPAGDPAAILEGLLGVPCVNVADGGTSIAQWTNGTLWGSVGQLAPGVVVYDTRYNDAPANNADYTYLAKYDALREQALAAGCELVLAGSYVPTATIAAGTSLKNQALMETLRAWAARTGVGWIEMAHALGVHTGATSGADAEAANYRWTIRAAYDPGDAVHLSQAGQAAMAGLVAGWLRSRSESPLAGAQADTALVATAVA